LIAGADVFIDTNILIYAALGRRAAPDRFAAARRIVLEENFGTSSQVLGEFYASVTRYGAPPLRADDARRWVQVVSRKPVQPVDAKIVASGIALSRRYEISYWDAAVLAAAEALGAATVYSDELEHGRNYGAVTVINPFEEAA